LAPSTFLLPLAVPPAPLFLRRCRYFLEIRPVSAAPSLPLTPRRRSSPALRPSPPPWPLLTPTRVCHRRPSLLRRPPELPPWTSPLRPSRTSFPLYIVALGRVEASPHPLAPLSLAGALLLVPPRCRQYCYRRQPSSRPPQARPSPQTGTSWFPLAPYPLPPATRAFPSPDFCSTELAPAGQGRGTCLRRFISF
jgi:hypothetical protein